MRANIIYKVIPAVTLILAVGCTQQSQTEDSVQPDFVDTNVQNTMQEVPEQELEQVKPLPSVPRPPSGIYSANFNGEQSVAPLEIRTQSGSDYYVKVVDSYNESNTLAIYIRGGETVEVEVPLGNYEIRYASATSDTWYGDKELFGPNTSYNKADEVFSFSNNGYQVSGYSITLYQVANGNLETKSIDESQF